MSKIKVGKQGRRYTLNGTPVEPKDFRMVSSFKFVNHLCAFIDGGAHGLGGDVHMSHAKRYIENDVIGLGCRCMRSPIELWFWGPPYFNATSEAPEPWRGWTNIANDWSVVNLRVGTGSGFSLPPKFKKLVRFMVNLAREFDIIIEIPWLWTIKGKMDSGTRRRVGVDADPRERHGISAWNEHYLGNEVDGIGRYLWKLEVEGDGEGPHRVDPGGLNLRHDFCNEYTAHSDEFTQAQLHNLARRWKARDTAGEMAEISQSSNGYTYEPPLASQHGPRGFDSVALHPPRNVAGWTNPGPTIRNRYPNELLNINESNMAWTPEQRDAWIELIPKWESLTTTNLDAWARMHESIESVGGYTCFHTLRGMDGGWPVTAQTTVEEAIKEYTGANGEPPPRPPDPPDPPDPPPTGGVKLTLGGNYTKLGFDDFPVAVDVPTMGNDPWRKTYRVDLGRTVTIRASDVFFGHDKGDSFEMDCHIYGDVDDVEHLRHLLARRIEEKVAPGGEANLVYELPESVPVRFVRVDITCRVTGKNRSVESGHPSYQRWRGEFDFNVMFLHG